MKSWKLFTWINHPLEDVVVRFLRLEAEFAVVEVGADLTFVASAYDRRTVASFTSETRFDIRHDS